MSAPTFSSHEEAHAHGTSTGSSDGVSFYNDGMRLHGRSQLDDLAAEAATVLQVEREFVDTWIDAYRAAAEEHLVREHHLSQAQKSNGAR